MEVEALAEAAVEGGIGKMSEWHLMACVLRTKGQEFGSRKSKSLGQSMAVFPQFCQFFVPE